MTTAPAAHDPVATDGGHAPDSPTGGLPARAYRRAVDRLPMTLRRWFRYRKVHGRFPSLVAPRTFSEKITWRILADRRPLLRITCDKLRMKDHARSAAPAGLRVPRTLWSGRDLDELLTADLRGRWVLKPNHRTGLVLFGEGPVDAAALARLREQTQGWLEPEEWRDGGEWAYSVAQQCLLVEERIGAPGDDLTDYKLLVFDGVVRFVQTDTDRFGTHGSRLYSTDWEYLGPTRNFPAGRDVDRPEELPDMLAAAAAIGAGFDFIRVDLYAHDGEIWFGELTPYPGSGLVAWADPALDEQLGECWRLPSA